MIIDCHTHLANPEHIGGEFLEGAQRAWGPDCDLSAAPKVHEAASRACDAVIVLPIDAEEIGYFTPNEFIADYVNQEPSRRIGFASVNIGGAFVIKDIAVVDGQKGMFARMPFRSYKTGSGETKYSDIAFALTDEARQSLNDAVLGAYREALEESEDELPDEDESPAQSM